jgi:ABC-type Na+ transport system ATPase subunit NatA
VRIAGLDLAQDSAAARRCTGFLSHRSLLYEDLTAQQNLDFYARLYTIPDRAARIAEALEESDLTARHNDLVRSFSRGMQQRLSVARALLHRPQLLLLDEPYAGLDPWAAEALSAHLRQLVAGGCTLLLTTHALDSAEMAAGSRLIILERGSVTYDASGQAAPRWRRSTGRQSKDLPQRSREAGHEVPAPGLGGDRQDMAAEMHTREILSAMAVFAVLALLIFSFTLDLRGSAGRAAAPGVLWATIAFAGTLGLSRSMAREQQTGGMEGCCWLRSSARRSSSGRRWELLLMLLVELILLPLARRCSMRRF